MQSAAELSIGASNIHDLVKPSVGDPDAGDVSPSTQLRAALGFRATQNLSIGFLHERGLAAGSNPVKSSEPPLKDNDVSGIGMTISYSIDTGSPGWRVGVSTEVQIWSVPWVQYTSCVQNCTVPGFTYMDHGSDSVPTLALAVIPSYRIGRVTIFGGGTVRNHPTITEKIVTNLPGPAEVQQGPVNVTLHGGADVELGAGIRASLIVHQTVTADPVTYGPGASLIFTIPLGSDVPHPSPATPASGPPGATPPT
ncbi:MAG: hypothetical protein JWO36_7218 [Myxococcales bacterium]|nr:hypothetical protein [Myxococcales bacterium]